MTALSALWLPILLSSVIVFVASSIIHMASPWHKGDYPKVPNEDSLRDALRPLAIPPGDYMVPRPSSRDEMKSPEFAEKVNQGPNVILTVLPNGPWTMSRNLSLWFLYVLLVNLCAAFVASHAIGTFALASRVTGFVGIIAFMGYSAALWQMSIWYRRAWSTTIKATVDGAIYALLTAAVFIWLWPR